MSNMSYCRFENTYSDLRDCYDAICHEDETSETETKYKMSLIKLCQRIISEATDQELIESEE